MFISSFNVRHILNMQIYPFNKIRSWNRHPKRCVERDDIFSHFFVIPFSSRFIWPPRVVSFPPRVRDSLINRHNVCRWTPKTRFGRQFSSPRGSVLFDCERFLGDIKWQHRWNKKLLFVCVELKKLWQNGSEQILSGLFASSSPVLFRCTRKTNVTSNIGCEIVECEKLETMTFFYN